MGRQAGRLCLPLDSYDASKIFGGQAATFQLGHRPRTYRDDYSAKFTMLDSEGNHLHSSGWKRSKISKSIRYGVL